MSETTTTAGVEAGVPPAREKLTKKAVTVANVFASPALRPLGEESKMRAKVWVLGED
jgi:hypothetical protein